MCTTLHNLLTQHNFLDSFILYEKPAVATMCVIRQLMNQHSIIDSFPKVLVEFDVEELEKDRNAARVPDVCAASISSGSTNASGVSTAGIVMASGKQKIAQDVNVFKGIAARMPPKALFHLLRGAASAMSEEMLLKDDRDEKRTQNSSQGRRRVRFLSDSTNENGFVKCQVHEIPKITDPSLWWQKEDFAQIRRNAGTVAERYRRYHDDYRQAIVQLLDYYAKRLKSGPATFNASHSSEFNSSKEELVRSFMYTIAEHEVARGLELHIVREYDRNNRKHMDAVLGAFDREANDTRGIRRACLTNSRVSHRMAYQFAKYDTKEALSCLLSPWSPWNTSNGGRPPLKPARSTDAMIMKTSDGGRPPLKPTRSTEAIMVNSSDGGRPPLKPTRSTDAVLVD